MSNSNLCIHDKGIPTMKLTFCPFSLAVFLGSAAYIVYHERQKRQDKQKATTTTTASADNIQVVFVLGGPGAGKGTQCQLVTERLLASDNTTPQWAHLSAGDLLRAERKKGGPLGDLINSRIAAGQLVPSEVTCQLIENAMNDMLPAVTKFLIDGFPRSHENAAAWNQTALADCVRGVLVFECPEEVLVSRIMARSKTSGRTDDTMEVIRKRFRTFQEKEGPIVDVYETKGLVQRIASDRSVEDIFTEVAAYLEGL